ncbi:hypothetical protein HD553DRAFT_311464 [Filobasidium floriforme]|uniref:uncharacterized protein n=1 Tax=Filobasidium floriforme TaxID=5210 RepID=UPI001E8CCEDC|nr:uncharacterized protein HD553DRAFT_311464 [Filobasidium floriforme]KAH8084687.1 hypothetical protein HD553DRAFT_311464 [Filobasidium floriforme]
MAEWKKSTVRNQDLKLDWLRKKWVQDGAVLDEIAKMVYNVGGQQNVADVVVYPTPKAWGLSTCFRLKKPRHPEGQQQEHPESDYEVLRDLGLNDAAMEKFRKFAMDMVNVSFDQRMIKLELPCDPRVLWQDIEPGWVQLMYRKDAEWVGPFGDFKTRVSWQSLAAGRSQKESGDQAPGRGSGESFGSFKDAGTESRSDEGATDLTEMSSRKSGSSDEFGPFQGSLASDGSSENKSLQK